MKLIFLHNGQVQLEDSNGIRKWASDSDEDFKEEFEGDFFNADDDSQEILEYLEEKGMLADIEECEIFEDDLGPGDDDDDDDDDDWDDMDDEEDDDA